ncbi:MAG: ATP-dependent helicase, partial [Candidatus Bipolaricaulia bacterium]
KRYQGALERSNSLDFADLIRLAVRLFQENLQVLNLYRERFRFILIDEYQDINYAQYVFARLLAEQYENICVVGDDDQAIYAWRGADPGWLLRFEEDFSTTRVVRLRVNYRSPGRVLRAAQALVKNNRLRKEKELEAIKDEGEPIRLYAALDGLDEAHYVAAEIERLRDVEGVELSEIAVLYRVNTLSRVIEEALIAHGIPYEVVRGLRFYERLEVKDLICYLRLVVNPADELSLLRVINRPRRGIGRRTITTIQSHAEQEGLSLWGALKRFGKGASAQERTEGISAAACKRIKEFVALIEGLRGRAGELGPAELAELVLKKTGYLEALRGDPAAEERLGNIKELLGQLREYESLGEFLEGVALLSEADSRTPTGRVALMTLHVAKGLEFEAVFIIGLEEGLLPHSRAIQGGEIEEERRLAYVGMTRAKRRLYLSFAAQRSLYGSLVLNPPSRVLAELPQGELEGSALELRPGYGF